MTITHGGRLHRVAGRVALRLHMHEIHLRFDGRREAVFMPAGSSREELEAQHRWLHAPSEAQMEEDGGDGEATA